MLMSSSSRSPTAEPVAHERQHLHDDEPGGTAHDLVEEQQPGEESEDGVSDEPHVPLGIIVACSRR